MRVVVVFLALLAYTAASGSQDEVITVDSLLGSYETALTNQPVIIVRKTTYYEPELVAVVVEKGVDNIPEDAVLIQNYADVLGASNNEIRVCAADSTCLDTPVTKLLVPSIFQSIGQTGFKKFFEHAKDVPWIATLDDTVKFVNPILSPKSSGLTQLLDGKPSILSIDSLKPIQSPKSSGLTQLLDGKPSILSIDSLKPIQVVPSDIFKYIPETPVPEYHAVYPSSISTSTRTETPQTTFLSNDVSRANFISPSATALPLNIQGGFTPLDQISTGGSILGGTARATYQQTPTFYNAPLLRAKRAATPIVYF